MYQKKNIANQQFTKQVNSFMQTIKTLNEPNIIFKIIIIQQKQKHYKCTFLKLKPYVYH